MHRQLRITLLGLTWLLSAIAVFQWGRPEPSLLESDASLVKTMKSTLEGSIQVGDVTPSAKSASSRPHPLANVSFDYPCMQRRFDANWRETMLEAMAMEDPDHAYVIMSDLTESLGAEDIEAAVDWAKSHRVNNEDPFYHLLWRWGELDANRALDFVRKNVTGKDEVEHCYDQVFSGAFIADPRKTIGLMQDYTSDAFAPSVDSLEFAFSMALKQNQHAVLEAIATLPEQSRKEFKEKTVDLLLKDQSYLQCLDLIASEDQDYRSNQYESIFGSWAENDPQAAMDWLKRSTSIEGKAYLEYRVAYEWMESDPVSYFAQFSSIKEAYSTLNKGIVDASSGVDWTHLDYFNNVFERWMESTPSKVTAWLDNTPDSPSKEALQAYIFSKQTSDDPVPVIRNINAISDPTVRNCFVKSFLLEQLINYGTVSTLLPNFPDLPFEDRTQLLQFEANGECYFNDTLWGLLDTTKGSIIGTILFGSSTLFQSSSPDSHQP